MARRANRIGKVEKTVLLAIATDFGDVQVVSRSRPFVPGFVSRSAPEPRLTGLDCLHHHFAGTEGHHQDLARGSVLDDDRYEAIRTECDRFESAVMEPRHGWFLLFHERRECDVSLITAEKVCRARVLGCMQKYASPYNRTGKP